MSTLQDLAALINTEFKAVLPAINSVVTDMTENYTAWQANPVVKSTEAVTAVVNPVAALDMQAVIGAASLVQALWQVFGQAPAAAATQTHAVPPQQTATTLQEQLAANGQVIPVQEQSHM